MDGASEHGWLQNVYGELKQRRVIRVATLYVVLFWPIIQIADILSPALDVPADAMRYLLIAFAGGLPIVLVLSWLFDLNRGGIVRTRPVDDGEVATSAPRDQALLGRRLERSLIGVLLIVIAVLFYVQYGAQTPTNGPSDTSSIEAIAVLPFATFSESPEDEFFADGLTEELLNVLSKLENLRVIARTSSFAYKNVNKSVQQIGFELEVDAILEGSVRRNDIDDTIRVTAQLVDVESGTHLWSQTFDRQFRDVFKIQDEIAGAVSEELRGTLAANEVPIGIARAPEVDAMVVVSMGRAELAKRTMQSMRDAVRFFERAVELDSRYADAHAGLARSHVLLHSYGDLDDTHLQQARASVTRAIEIDPNSADAWATLGLLEKEVGAVDEARESLRKAISLNPNHAMAHMWLAEMQQDAAQKQRFYARAFELDPRSAVAGYNLANDLFLAGREAQALDVFGRVVEADPYYPKAYELVGRINEANGRIATAIRHYEHSFELEPRADTALQLADLFIDIGKFDRSDAWLEKARGMAGPADTSRLRWTAVSSLAARGDRARAEALLAPLLEEAEELDELMDATVAGYLLSQPADAVAAWEKAREQLRRRASDGSFGLDRDTVTGAIAAAHAYQALGSDEAADLLVEIEEWIDGVIATNARVGSETWYAKAQVSAIRGQRDLALLELQRAIDNGWRQHWRPLFEPCFSDVVETENFAAMMAGLATRMELMAEELEFDDFFASA
jgi:TolB-like protein/Tfp pilus assembly protein PilF